MKILSPGSGDAPPGRPMRLVHVKWRDAFGVSANWQDIDKAKLPQLVVESVGWVLLEDDDSIMLAPHLHASEAEEVQNSYCGDMTIPKCSIVNIADLVPDEGHRPAAVAHRTGLA